MTDYISRADAIEAVCNAQCELDVPHYPRCDQVKYCDEIQALLALPSADAESDDLIIKGAKGIQDGLYNIKDGKLFKYKAKGGTVRTYPIVPSADLPTDDDDIKDRQIKQLAHDVVILEKQLADRPCKTCGYYNIECPKDCEYGIPITSGYIADDKEVPLYTTTSAVSADRPTEDYSDLPDIPRAYYERIVGNMSHEINMLKQQLEDRPMVHSERPAEWIKEIEGNGWNEWENITCSRCGAKVEKVKYLGCGKRWNYCPNCGAFMKGGAE